MNGRYEIFLNGEAVCGGRFSSCEELKGLLGETRCDDLVEVTIIRSGQSRPEGIATGSKQEMGLKI